jgi:hypothetical protein
MLELKVYGFNEKLPVLLSKILSAARSFMPTDDRYQVSGIFVSISLILSPLSSIYIAPFLFYITEGRCVIEGRSMFFLIELGGVRVI